MSATHLTTAAAPFVEIVRNVGPGRPAAPTSCAEYDVRALVNHLLFWGPSLTGAADKRAVPPPAAAESDVDLAGPGWAAALTDQTERLVAAWTGPGAWEGPTRMGDAELPAELVGGMVAGELVVHGWDLARASGQHPEWDEDLLRYVHGEVARSAAQGREIGVYGPEVPVRPERPHWTACSASPDATRPGRPNTPSHPPPHTRVDPPHTRVDPPRGRVDLPRGRVDPPRGRVDPSRGRVALPRDRRLPPSRAGSAMPGDDSSMPEVDSTMPEVDSTMPEDDSTMPEDDSTMPEDDSTMPEDDSTMPEDDSPVPGSTGSCPLDLRLAWSAGRLSGRWPPASAGRPVRPRSPPTTPACPAPRRARASRARSWSAG